MRGFIADDGVGQPHGVSCRVLKEDVEVENFYIQGEQAIAAVSYTHLVDR